MDQHDWIVLLSKCELMLAWSELEGLHTDRIAIMRPKDRRSTRQWKAERVPARAGIRRPLSASAKGALNLTLRGRPRTDGVTFADIEKARGELVQILQAFGHEVFA